jgi:hypothetical protein
VSATVWARGSFAAMAVAELVAVAELFPSHGSSPGVSAWFNYGFSWGYGGGWEVVVNAGFDTRSLLQRLSAQATTDFGRALASYRERAGLPDDSPLLLIDAAQTILPLTLDSLVTWSESELTLERKRTHPRREPSAQREALGDTLHLQG